MAEVKGACPNRKYHNDPHNSDGSDSYSFNSDKGVGKCYSCGLSSWTDEKGNLWGKTAGNKTSPLEIIDEGEQEEYMDTSVEEVVGEYKSCRGVAKDTMEFFGVVTDGKHQYYQYPSGGYKVRNLEEKGFHAKGLKQNELWGRNLFPTGCARKIVVTEGELDAMSAWQMLQSGSYVNPVVSVPSATPSSAFWENNKDYLGSFEQILLSLDRDKPGRELAGKIAEMFPGKVYEINHLDLKDANEVLQAGKAQEYKASWWKPKMMKSFEDMLISSSDYLDLFDESPDFEYFPTGIEALDSKILGICKGYLTLIQADTGVGKSEFVRYLEWQCLKNSSYKLAAKHLEETKLRSLLGLCSYDLNENVTIKKHIEDKGLVNDVRASIQSITDSGRFITFDIDEEGGNDALMAKLRYMIAAFGVDYIIIEPIQDAVTGANSSEKEGKLSDLVTRMSNLCAEKNVGIVVIAHQNGDGGSMYSSMITKRAAFKIKLKGDRSSEDSDERNRTYLSVEDKNRVGMGFGPAGSLDFSLESYTLTPTQGPVEPKTPNREDF